MKHLSPETLLDIAEGTRTEGADRHLATCAACRERLADLRTTLAAVAVDVPEPSPLFWAHLSSRVREAAAAEASRSRSTTPFRKMFWTLAAATSVAVVVIAVSLTWKTSSGDVRTVGPSAIATDTSSANVGAAIDDPSLDLLADLAGGLDWDAAADAGMTMDVGAADQALIELTSAERIELQRLLREAMSGSGA